MRFLASLFSQALEREGVRSLTTTYDYDPPALTFTATAGIFTLELLLDGPLLATLLEAPVSEVAPVLKDAASRMAKGLAGVGA